MIFLLIYLFGALSLSFLCSVLEAVLLSTPMSYISMLESRGARSASLLKRYKRDIDRPISAILSLNTIAHTVGAAGVGAEATHLFGEAYFGVVSAVMTLLILVFSEIIPKIVGATYWRSLAIPTARVVRVLIFITYPLVVLSDLIMHAVAHGKQEQSVSREEVSAMVNVGAEEGVFKMRENRIIQSFIKLDKVTAEQIMTPSVVVASAAEATTMREFYDNPQFRNYSRIPVYAENKDYITGYVLRATVLERLSEDRFNETLSSIVRPIFSFPETESVSNIWEKMIENKEHISIIIDDYGCLRGIVTMEDVLETMLGVEIVDENDATTDMQKLAREKWQRMKKVARTPLDAADAAVHTPPANS